MPARGLRALSVLACHCLRVNDGVVQAAIEAGATDLVALAQLCRAGSGCGGCHPTLEGFLRKAAAKADHGFRHDDRASFSPV